MSTNLVAIYDSHSSAEEARKALVSKGFTDVRLSRDNNPSSASDNAGTMQSGSHAADNGGTGLFSWLIGSTDDSERAAYKASLHSDRTAVSVYADKGRETEAEKVMEQFNPIEFDAHVGSQGAQASGKGGPTSMSAGSNSQSDEVIPIVKEQMSVGKQVEEKRYRIRSYTVERPVEETVNLHDERVILERRPASGATANASMQPKEFEVVERHEKPVVSKTANVEEEVVVHRDVSQRQEKVHGSVRETRVETDQGSGSKARH